MCFLAKMYFPYKGTVHSKMKQSLQKHKMAP